MDIETYALAKSYVAKTADGLGAVRGKPCTIKKIEPIEGGNRVTFQWTGDSGAVQTLSLNIKDGKDAPTITNVELDALNRFVVSLSDGTSYTTAAIDFEQDPTNITYANVKEPTVTNVKQALDELINKKIENAESVIYNNSIDNTIRNVKQALDLALSGGAVLKERLVVSNPVGSATNGKTYDIGTDLETIIRDILVKEVAPGLTFTITPETTLYDVVEQKVSALRLKANVTKNTYDLDKVDFYLGNTLKKTQSITTAGLYTYDLSFATPTNTDFTVKAIAYDKKTGTPMTTTKSITVKFVGKSYYGTVAADVSEPTEAIIKSLQNNILKDTKNLTYSNINMDYGKVVYAYPASFGNLASIKDLINNFSYWPDSFTKKTLVVDSINYNVYIQNEASAAESLQLTFA